MPLTTGTGHGRCAEVMQDHASACRLDKGLLQSITRRSAPHRSRNGPSAATRHAPREFRRRAEHAGWQNTQLEEASRELQPRQVAYQPKEEEELDVSKNDTMSIPFLAGVLDLVEASTYDDTIKNTTKCGFSRGTFGHPFLCGVPCKYAGRSKGCRDGTDCLSCHTCKWTRRTNGLRGKERMLVEAEEQQLEEFNNAKEALGLTQANLKNLTARGLCADANPGHLGETLEGSLPGSLPEHVGHHVAFGGFDEINQEWHMQPKSPVSLGKILQLWPLDSTPKRVDLAGAKDTRVLDIEQFPMKLVPKDSETNDADMAFAENMQFTEGFWRCSA